MSETLAAVQALVARGEVRISDHGYDELADDGISAGEVVPGLEGAVVVEDYRHGPRGRSVLVLLRGADGGPVHVVWVIAAGNSTPAVMVTAYRPDPSRWSATT
ncbi:MAG: DUF4258 domain-containing protein [Geminicoccaceae bacterium]